MATAWVSFGPDLEPLEEETRRATRSPGARRDGIAVAGTAGEVAARLREAQTTSGGWCTLELVTPEGGKRAVHVNGAMVRFVVDDDE